MDRLLPDSFRSIGPVLPDVRIVEVWAEYDGPLFGVCETGGGRFFFQDVVYDIWRYYSETDCERLWTIYAAYDINVDEIRAIINKSKIRELWATELATNSNVIGIFWEYEK